MIAFLIEVVKALVTFFAVCVGLGILYLVFVVVREVGWEVRRQNREKHEQEDKEAVSYTHLDVYKRQYIRCMDNKQD